MSGPDFLGGRGVGIAEVDVDEPVDAVRIATSERTYEVTLNEDGLGLILEPDIDADGWWPRRTEKRVDGKWLPVTRSDLDIE